MQSSELAFIGRGEETAKQVLERLFCTKVRSQVSLKELIDDLSFQLLNEEIQKHKFDFLVENEKLVIEVNYKHGEKAAKKWNDIFTSLLKEFGYIPATIDDYNCKSLFKLSKNKEHKLSWNDFRDVINCLEAARVEP